MIKRRKWLFLTLALLLLLTAGISTFLLTYEQKATPEEIYIEMVAAFDLGSYEQARQLITSGGLVEQEIKDARLYKVYLDALARMDEGAYNVAAELFSAVDQSSPAFHQADQWALYCQARQYEEIALPKEACSLYAKLNIGDSIERYLACMGFPGLLESEAAVRSRHTPGEAPAGDLYAQALDLYYLEDYGRAADYFCLAGQYSDARQWRCYCTAIDLIAGKEALSDAQVLFELLSSQGFLDASSWLVYCNARSFEAIGFQSSAAELYKTIAVFDSLDRYLACTGSAGLLSTGNPAAETTAALSAAELYEQAVEYQQFGMYAEAADAFSLAGNYQDAQLRQCYCRAVSLTDSEETLSDARTLFELLGEQSYGDAQSWLIYCDARSFQSIGFGQNAAELYKTIAVGDSFQRYLACLGKENLLEDAEAVRARTGEDALTPAEHYEHGQELCKQESYAAAADQFCLAMAYMDAPLWHVYCSALAAVTTDNMIDDAIHLLDYLSAQSFADAADWITYCNARICEEHGLYANAIELYKAVISIHDSSERCQRLLID